MYYLLAIGRADRTAVKDHRRRHRRQLDRRGRAVGAGERNTLLAAAHPPQPAARPGRMPSRDRHAAILARRRFARRRLHRWLQPAAAAASSTFCLRSVPCGGCGVSSIDMILCSIMLFGCLPWTFAFWAADIMYFSSKSFSEMPTNSLRKTIR